MQYEVSMNKKVSEAFGTVDRLDYVYDYGSSTELVVRSMGTVRGSLKGVVQLAARNEPPTWPCDECGKTATVICSQCQYEGGGFFCARHESGHGCGEEMLLPVVNSPRMGVCGYCGED
jgi:hypothetical protein